MKKILILALALCLILSAVLTGCNGSTPTQSSSPSGSQETDSTIDNDETDTDDDEVTTGGEVNVFNWGEYMDMDILAQFEEETGIKVNYMEFQSNEEMYSIIKYGMATYDVIIPSDYMISRMIDEGLLEELDFSNIPNIDLIDDAYKNLEYDPEGKYSVAYMTGTVGLIYNSAMIDEEITSWAALFDEAYAGQILMFNNQRDAFGIALKYLGYDQNTINEDEIREAYDLLLAQKPILQAYVMDQIFDKLESGEAAIGPYYAGDYLIMVANNPDLVFVRPEEGSNFFVDAMCIPVGARNKTNAEIFINYISSTEIAYQNMEFIWYASANFEAAEEFMEEELDDDEMEIMFASEETLENCDVFINLPTEILDLYDTLWSELKR
ncbi:MAG: spermidine/putrescine ABC transporter substrate-binding protein [Oscillospiraceae bacterium]|nr:spermidine/putrescine ABC transporter substrate-binding protein [Oscillospiraceae bacterium]